MSIATVVCATTFPTSVTGPQQCLHGRVRWRQRSRVFSAGAAARYMRVPYIQRGSFTSRKHKSRKHKSRSRSRSAFLLRGRWDYTGSESTWLDLWSHP